MASSLFSLCCRSSSNQLLKSYTKFSPIVSHLPLLSNRSFSHDHHHKKKLLNPTTTTTNSTWSFSDSTTLSKFLGSTQEKLINPNPSFITSSSTCYYTLNKNMPKTCYTNYISSNCLSNPSRNLGLRSFSTSSSDEPDPIDIELVAKKNHPKKIHQVEVTFVANEKQQVEVALVAKELQHVLPQLLRNSKMLSISLTPLCFILLFNVGWVSYLSLGAFAFPLWVASSFIGMISQNKFSFHDKPGRPDPLQTLNKFLGRVKMLNRFIIGAWMFTYFFLFNWVLDIFSVDLSIFGTSSYDVSESE